MKRYEVKVWNEKENLWNCQSFPTKRQADSRANVLRENGRTVKVEPQK